MIAETTSFDPDISAFSAVTAFGSHSRTSHFTELLFAEHRKSTSFCCAKAGAPAAMAINSITAISAIAILRRKLSQIMWAHSFG
ncbi:protein of unknown function (plasmid) [Azospirillum lipoferum 4B]|uniref:Uncharacterized protein n=1 Tax=Azospirillum lipoferum (strain 4B) TaxID=862719 RepID=G7ZGJ9_AZOL4|nr:protein of unknown function [Azospirillum lipoferum 4B]